METIEADIEDTWPEEMRTALSEYADDIASYHSERAHIDHAIVDDLMLRANPPSNPHEPAWKEILRISNEAVARQHILGFHATRLTESERDG
jgi:hypothetical protein